MSAPDKAPDWKGFGEAIMEDWHFHGDIEASEKFDLAVRFNILTPIPGGFDPESHSDEVGEAEKGDPWYEMNRRADVADAMVAAAYEAAAKIADDQEIACARWVLSGLPKPIASEQCAVINRMISALTTSDARAALAEAERKAWNAAIEAAMKQARRYVHRKDDSTEFAIAALKKEPEA